MNLINALNTENPEIDISDELLETYVWSALLDTGASIPAVPEDIADTLEKSGLELYESLIFGRNADGHVTEGKGKFESFLRWDVPDDLAHDTYFVLTLQKYGRNAFIIIPILKLADFGFTLISASSDIGTYFVTPSNGWHRCYIQNSIPFLDLRFNIYQNRLSGKNRLEIEFNDPPAFYFDIRKLIVNLITNSNRSLEKLGLSENSPSSIACANF